MGSLESVPEVDRDEEEELLKRYIPYNDFEPEYRIKDFDFWRLYYTAFSRAKNLLILSCVESNKGKRQIPSLPFKRVYETIPDILSGKLDFSELNIENTSVIDIKDSYSYTGDLLKYKECPYRYKLNKIYDFQRKKTVENFYGTLIHESFEYINLSIVNNRNLTVEDIESRYYSDYEAMKKKENLFLDKETLKRGLEQVLKYYNSDLMGMKIVDVEKSLFIFRQRYTIEGKLDLVVEDGESLKVIDFKTGSDSLDEESLKNYISQIKLYCYLLSMNSEKRVSGGYIYFVKNENRIEIPYILGDEEQILKDFDFIAERISNGIFSEKRLSEEKCLKCEFKKHCFGINMI